MRFFLFILFCTRLFAFSFDDVEPSTPEEIQSLQTTLLVEGYVSAMSGQLSLSETDLTVRGAQNLTLKRTYIPPQISGRYSDSDQKDRLQLGKALYQLQAKGWVVHPHLWAGYNPHSKHFQLRDPSGFTLEFAIANNRGELKSACYGMSNVRGDTPSGGADLRNIALRTDGDQVIVRFPDGTKREYIRQNPVLWRLEREVLPNGKAVRYEYNAQGLTKIISCDKSGQYTYASIVKQGDEYIGSDGRKAALHFETREIQGKSTKDHFKEQVTVQFPVMTQSSSPVYANTASYNNRSLLISYDARDYPIACDYTSIKNTIARIDSFSTPSGKIRLSYDPPIAGEKGGSTTVFYPDGAKLIYRFNKLLLLERMENWQGSQLINQKTYSYDEKQHIKSIETKDAQGALLTAKRFVCDEAGNPVLETTEGDFGSYSIQRTFDQNRLTSERNDKGLEYRFTYLGDTNLELTKETWANNELLRKTVCAYDEAYNLIEAKELGKTKTTYTLYPSGPYLHRVKTLEQRDWDGHLIRKTEYSYDQWGNTCQEKHFGADGNFAYEIHREYDEKDNLLSQSNALGETALYQYDARGRCIQENPIANDLVLQRIFDAKGRLIAIQENEQKTTFQYNESDEITEQTDYLGVTTKYVYHPIHAKPTQIIEPTGATHISYDAFGRESQRIDPTGAITKTLCNSRGDIAKIIHPEGGEEIFVYEPNGWLQSHIDADGLITSYTYDPLGRILQQKMGDLATTYRYDEYHLIEEIDPAGYSTNYEYDQQGRKIAEKREGRLTHYRYDTLGFLAKETRDNRFIQYKNDSLGRILSKSIDGLLETSWVYDSAGNKIQIQKGDAVTAMTYDAHNRLTSLTDPEGNQIQFQYQVGSQTLIETSTNPLGILTVKTYNPQGQLLAKQVAGKLVEKRSYDVMHRLEKQDHIAFTYTSDGQKRSMTESSLRTTSWLYTPAGRLQSEQKPDGTILACAYDAQGKLIQKGSREFRYDPLGRLTGGTGFTRTLDPFGNILREEWTTGLWIESAYDNWNRPLTRTLSNGTQIAYAYEGPFLTQITRVDADGKTLYTHQFDHYDARGNAQREKGFFETSLQYDKLGRKTQEESPYSLETIQYDSLGRVIQKNDTFYTYDDLSQMTFESEKFTAAYDEHYNLCELNGTPIAIDTLNQIQSLAYDGNGNLKRSGFCYDELGQLIQAGEENYTYDALGRRIQKGNTAYLYIDDEEIASFENGTCKELKIGETKPIAIEIDGAAYAPIIDVQGTIRKLIDTQGQIAQENTCDAFGLGVSATPYGYLGKRCDLETGLIYFGQRFYDPSLRRWLTPDPLGSIDHSNLYQYVFNNPYAYCDPNGQFAFAIPLLFWGAELAVPAISAYITAIGYGAAAGAVAYGGYKLIETVNDITSSTISYYNLRGGTEFYKNNEAPPYDGRELGTDPTASPGEEFEWRGKGKPGSKAGSWYNPITGESLHPDLDHPLPIKPHWDYESANGGKARLNTDGTWEWKK